MKDIIKGASWIFLAQVVVKLISFGYTLILIRILSVESFGLYIVALAYFSLISSISDLGFNRFLIREGSIDKRRLSEYLTSVVFLRLSLTITLVLGFSGWLLLFDQDELRVGLSILALVAVIPQSLALTLDGVLVATQRLYFSAVALVGLSLTTTILGVTLLLNGFEAEGVIWALILGQLAYFLILLWMTKKLGVKILNSISDLRLILKGSLPYGILGVLGIVYFKIDALMLSYLRGNIETGYYGAAYKFLEAALFIPSALATALFPVLSKSFDINLKKVKEIYLKSLGVMILAAIPVTLAYIYVLPILINNYFPAYIPSQGAIYILAWTIPFMFLHVPGAAVLLSTNKYLKSVIILSFITLGFNILGNLFLIPKEGFIGAAKITVLSEALSLGVFGSYLYFKVLRNV